MPHAINRTRLTHGLDLPNLCGIEIGPLVNPIVTRDESDVRYVDRASTEELREWYSRDEKINVDEIMHIDYVWGDQTLAEATGGTEQFDYCIASHVIEHVPDLISWLGEIASILKPGGLACFAVPDKRYTFDYLRNVTTTSDVVDSYLRKLRKPSYRHIFDHFANYTELDILTAWSAGFDGAELQPMNSPAHALKACQDAMQDDRYIDSHCSVFTEKSFFPLLESVSALGMLDFRIHKFFPVKPGMFEFVVQLEKLDTTMTDEAKHKALQQSLTAMRETGLEIEFSSNRPCAPKLYYDIGGGFNEVEMVEAIYTLHRQTKTLKFKLPLAKDIKLRFDPADTEIKLRIDAVRHRAGGAVRELELSSIQPLSQIAMCKIRGDHLVARAAKGATDPAFLIDLPA